MRLVIDKIKRTVPAMSNVLNKARKAPLECLASWGPKSFGVTRKDIAQQITIPGT